MHTDSRTSSPPARRGRVGGRRDQHAHRQAHRRRDLARRLAGGSALAIVVVLTAGVLHARLAPRVADVPTAAPAVAHLPVPDADRLRRTGAGRVGSTHLEERVRPRPPTRLSIPAIGVRAQVGRIGVTAEDGRRILQPPEATAADLLRAYWWEDRSAPGYPSTGTTFLIGHTCRAQGCPAVFNRLQQIRPGDEVTVGTGSGRLTYRVFDTASYSKSTITGVDAVYADVPGRLVLVTCKLREDGAVQTDNFVAWARLTGSSRVPHDRSAARPGVRAATAR